MILIYRILTKLIYPFLLIITFLRILLKKEDPIRYKEKIFISHFNVQKKKNEKLVWFHAASIGELKSILPIIRKLNSDILDLDILVTTSTLSSSKIAEIEFKKFTNVLHRFFPFDLEYLMDNFLKLWRPNFIFFVDSEIWPNLILKSKKFGIPLAIINARITSKSFKRWMFFPKTAFKIFNAFDLCLASNSETKIFLEKLKVKEVNYNGNIKFIGNIDENNINDSNKNILTKKRSWVAASTHLGEEELCLKTHIVLKERYDDILTIIAPRHIDRSKNIKSMCKKYNLKVQLLNDDELIKPNIEILILNSFGQLQNYFKYTKSVFIGKSTVKKLKNVGGQNPLEAARLNCKIYHGPYVYNFKDVYKFLEKNKISKKIYNFKDLSKNLTFDFKYPQKQNLKNKYLINKIGKKTMADTMIHINNFLDDKKD